MDASTAMLSVRAWELVRRDRAAGRLWIEPGEVHRFGLALAIALGGLTQGSELAQAAAAEARIQATGGKADDELDLRVPLLGFSIIVVSLTVLVLIVTDAFSAFGPAEGLMVGFTLINCWATLHEWRATRRRRVLVLVEARQRVEELLRSEIIAIAFHLHRFAPRPPHQDPVEVERAGGFATRIADDDQVLEVAAMREVRAHLARRGGAVLGIGGERGAGKSELIRAFCRSSEGDGEQPVVGAFVAAPTTPDVEAFVRLVVAEVCEAVPGFRSHEHRLRTIRQRSVRIGALVVGVALTAIGVARVFDMTWPSGPWRDALGWAALVGGGAIVLTTALVVVDAGAYTRVAVHVWSSWRARSKARRRAAPGETGRRRRRRPERPHRQIREAAALERGRGDAVRRARRLHHEVRHLETLTTTKELGLSGRGATLGLGSSRSLAALPQTSADLVHRLDALVKVLRAATFRVVIGIDELDRLEAGEETDRFLNGIKQLFTIRDCSYLVSLSESARAQFHRHGVDVLGVLDSSLDDTVVVDAFDSHAARHLLRRRGEERMSDTQVLLCLALSGGRPRELLRQSRSLAASKQTATTTSTTAVAADAMVEERWTRHRDDASDRVTTWERSAGRSALLVALADLDLDQATTLALPPVDPRWPRVGEARDLVQELAAQAQVLATVRAVFGTTGRPDRAPDVRTGDALAHVLRAVDDDPVAGLRQLDAVRAELAPTG